jgi:hypothetical protein
MKEIILTDDGRDYTLVFTRNSVAKLEQQFSFKIENLGDKPMTTLPLLFYGAFLEKQPYLKREVANKILEKLVNKRALIDKLSEMYGDAVNSLIDEPETTEGNATWEASF